ncbi:hypothetical protein D9Q98_008152 [Chlorella vulgaris]|uniref:Uncharacterized protein n=1 Tax=Chlorella vulgaris TaxID=3077 RepID=A0A9D4YSY4_CHLVU|nr:hypothetical protein D9Q98_008152 [Chlorella vulgaris]
MAAEPRADRSVDVEQASAAGRSPWTMGYQLNERYLAWDSSAQRQLILIWVAQQLDVTLPDVECRVAQLTLLLPGLDARLDRMQAKLVLALVSDLPAVTARILALRQILPSLNLGLLVAQHPWVLTDVSLEHVLAKVTQLREALGTRADVERVIQEEPMLLLADIKQVLAELQRLLPHLDPALVLQANPSQCLDMQTAGMKSSLEIDGGTGAA